MAQIFDINKLIKDTEKLSKSLDSVCENIADKIVDHLLEELKEEAHKLGTDIGRAYENGLDVSKKSTPNLFEYSIKIDEDLKWAEEGKDAHWMGEYLLKEKKTGKNLDSRVIPISNKFKDISSSNSYSNSNKNSIADELRELSSIVSAADVRAGGYSKVDVKSVKRTKADLLTQKDSETISASTVTFRTINKKSEGSAWMKKQQEGAKLLEKLEKEAPDKVKELLQSILDKK